MAKLIAILLLAAVGQNAGQCLYWPILFIVTLNNLFCVYILLI